MGAEPRGPDDLRGDGRMTYPFVAARWFTPGAIVQYRAIVIHHAEGGGTVTWLTQPTSDVSASHVIEYSGRIVQMVKDGDASHCQHVSPEPYTSENYGIYSSLTGRAVLGADGWADVNRYVFAVEIEGFRAKGPNDAQKVALKALVTDLRGRFPSIRGLLGHRDVQDKSCPGGLIPWAEIGGHGMFEEDEVITAIKGEEWKPTVTGTQSNGVFRESPDRSAPIVERVGVDVVIRSIAEIAAGGLSWRVTERMGKTLYMLRTDWTPLVQGGDPVVDALLSDFIAGRDPAPPIDCTPLVNAARAEGVAAGLRDGSRAVKDAAVNAAVLLGG